LKKRAILNKLQKQIRSGGLSTAPWREERCHGLGLHLTRRETLAASHLDRAGLSISTS